MARLQELFERAVAIESLEHVRDCVARRRAYPRVPATPKNCIRLVPAKRRAFVSTGNAICPFTGLLFKPSDGLEPSTPSLPCAPIGNWSQPVATVLACLSRFRSVRICHRLPPVATARLHKRSIPVAGIPMRRIPTALAVSFERSPCFCREGVESPSLTAARRWCVSSLAARCAPAVAETRTSQ